MNARRPRNVLSMATISIIVIMLIVVLRVNCGRLEEKKAGLLERQVYLTEHIKSEEARTEEIEAYRKYTQTIRYVEDSQACVRDTLPEDEDRREQCGIVVPGLSDFVATDGRFSQDVPPLTKALASMYRTGSGLTTVSAFSFEGTFTCMYGGVRCEAKYAASFAVSVSAVRNPKVPKICSWARVSPTLVVAPPGKVPPAGS